MFFPYLIATFANQREESPADLQEILECVEKHGH